MATGVGGATTLGSFRIDLGDPAGRSPAEVRLMARNFNAIKEKRLVEPVAVSRTQGSALA
jgi:hypothetical protein